MAGDGLGLVVLRRLCLITAHLDTFRFYAFLQFPNVLLGLVNSQRHDGGCVQRLEGIQVLQYPLQAVTRRFLIPPSAHPSTGAYTVSYEMDPLAQVVPEHRSQGKFPPGIAKLGFESKLIPQVRTQGSRKGRKK